MDAYFYWIGGANLVGMALLLGALSDDFADGLLRRWTQIIPVDKPFAHGEYSRIWLWWAIIGAGFYGAINLVASTWPREYAIWIVYGNIYAYAFFEVLAIAGTVFSNRYGPGLRFAHLLWIGQGGWGVYVALS